MQTGLMAPRVRDLGHDVALSVYYGLQGAQMQWDGMTCYPSYSAPYGSDVIVPHALHHFQAEKCRSIEEASTRGIILTLGDVWTFESPLLDQLCVGSWVPVDHLGVPEVVAGWFGVMGAIPVAMSRFGEQALRDIGLNPLYVPHGIDTAVFRPGDKAAARAAAGLPEDAFVVAMVANNVGRDGNRKAFSEQIRAFGRLHGKHPDTMLILHTDVDQPSGMRLRNFLEQHLPRNSYTYTDIYMYRKGLNPSAVADIYRAADVLSNCSYGEGFGIPVVEAQACGTPVVVTDATAMPELCGSGWKVGYEEMWHDSQGAWAAIPRIGDIADAYEQAYEKARDESMRAEAYAFAQDYDADVVAEKYWRPALATFEGLLDAKRKDLAAAAKQPRRLPERIRQADGLMWIDRGQRTGDGIGWADHEAALKPIFENLLPEGGVFLPNGQIEGGSTRVLPADNWAEGPGSRANVEAGRLDEALADEPRIDLIKLDVEGADLHAIEGMAGLLGRCRPAMLIEDHSIYGYYSRTDLEELLDRLGYGWKVADSTQTVWLPGGVRDVAVPGEYLLARPRVKQETS